MQNLVIVAVLFRGTFAGWCDEWDAGTLEWSDEFDGDKLDSSKWSVVCNDMEGANCGALPFGTHDPTSNGAECRSATCIPEAVSVGNGNLILTSARDPANSSAWTTGAVKTWEKATWTPRDGTYRMCISAKLPGGGGGAAGQGIWPAHWMMPQDNSCDPDEGEMDIMEMVSGDGTQWATYHWQDNWPAAKCAYPEGHQHVYAGLYMGEDWADGFHEYGVERAHDYVAFSVDGKVIVNSTSSDVPVALWPVPFYLILNSAVGGSWPGEPNASTVSPTYHLVDYVRLAREKA
jgi:beta-glucanase (GH16 family)